MNGLCSRVTTQGAFFIYSDINCCKRLSWKEAGHQVRLEAHEIGHGAPGQAAPTVGQESTRVGTSGQRLFLGQAENPRGLGDTASTPTSAKPHHIPLKSPHHNTVPITTNSGFFCCPGTDAGYSRNPHTVFKPISIHPKQAVRLEQKGSLVASVPDLCSSVYAYFPNLL